MYDDPRVSLVNPQRRVRQGVHPPNGVTVGPIPLSRMIERIAHGAYAEIVLSARDALETGNPKLSALIKSQLPAFLPGGVFTPTTRLTDLRQPSGILVYDWEALDLVRAGTVAEEFRDVLAGLRSCQFAFVSCRRGVKAAFRVDPPPPTPEAHKIVWHGLEAWLRENLDAAPETTDLSSQNQNRLTYASYDEDAFLNDRVRPLNLDYGVLPEAARSGRPAPEANPGRTSPEHALALEAAGCRQNPMHAFDYETPRGVCFCGAADTHNAKLIWRQGQSTPLGFCVGGWVSRPLTAEECEMMGIVPEALNLHYKAGRVWGVI